MNIKSKTPWALLIGTAGFTVAGVFNGLQTMKTIPATKSLLISAITGIVIVTIVVPILGQLVDRKIESIMILHDFYIVLAIMTGAGFIGVISLGNNIRNQRHSADILKYISIIVTIAVFAIIITGTIGYIEYRLSESDSAKSIITRTFPFAHEVMFAIHVPSNFRLVPLRRESKLGCAGILHRARELEFHFDQLVRSAFENGHLTSADLVVAVPTELGALA